VVEPSYCYVVGGRSGVFIDGADHFFVLGQCGLIGCRGSCAQHDFARRRWPCLCRPGPEVQRRAAGTAAVLAAHQVGEARPVNLNADRHLDGAGLLFGGQRPEKRVGPEGMVQHVNVDLQDMVIR
jgi:hypothetical protein